MKKLLLIALLAGAALEARVVYDPAANIMWSEPKAPEISMVEYFGLLTACNTIKVNMKASNNGKQPAKKNVFEQAIFWLKRVGTPTALRLIQDIEEDKIFYLNGSYAMPFSNDY